MIVHKINELEDVWCPETRLIVLNNGKVMTNRGSVFEPMAEDPKGFCHCLGDKCAHWEWHVQDEEGYCLLVDPPYPGTVFRREKPWKAAGQ